jgi:carbamate kinase
MGTGKKIVLALGGNALQTKDSPPTAQAQRAVVEHTCGHIAQLSAQGYELAIVHGNGPQVGRILLTSETARDVVPPMPFDVCGAMSQGYIGYHIQQALRYALARQNLDIPVVTLVTQMVVDPHDPAFAHTTKPIGPFYTQTEAQALAAQEGYTVGEDAGRGWRRLVPSPLPQRIVELSPIQKLWDDAIVITCGGGGVPVMEKPDGTLEGVAAVIDKDFAAALLAEEVQADVLMILTEVEQVCLHWGKSNQQPLSHLTLAQAAQYVEQGQFAPGSMLPKVEAAMKFVRSHPDKTAIITALDKAQEALAGRTGTHVTFA